jgi:hypothetical protein
MPFDYAYEPENRLLTITGKGDVSLEDRYDCVRRMMSDKSADKESNILINVCEVTNKPSSDDIPAIVSLIMRLRTRYGGRIAILNTVAGHVTLTNLIALSADIDDGKVRAFLSDTEALKWLKEH